VPTTSPRRCSSCVREHGIPFVDDAVASGRRRNREDWRRALRRSAPDLLVSGKSIAAACRSPRHRQRVDHGRRPPRARPAPSAAIRSRVRLRWRGLDAVFAERSSGQCERARRRNSPLSRALPSRTTALGEVARTRPDARAGTRRAVSRQCQAISVLPFERACCCSCVRASRSTSFACWPTHIEQRARGGLGAVGRGA